MSMPFHIPCRATMAACAAAAILATAARAADVPAQPPGATRSYSIALARGQRVTLPEESLTVSFVDLEDQRCPVDLECAAIGYAWIRLQVDKPGSATGVLTIGTETLRLIDRPADARYGPYRFSLVSLEPGRSSKDATPPPDLRAFVRISKF